MFGYVKPHIPELKVKEHELYKSMYCGLCLAMGKHISQLDRFTLSYDTVFLAIARAAVTNEDIHIEKERCIAHPLKKRNHAYVSSTLEYCAKVSALLTYYNLADDVADTKGIASLGHKLMLPCAKGFLKKADMPDLADKLEGFLDQLCALEKNGGSLDRNAEVFGSLLGEISAYDIENNDARSALYGMGFHVGKWIYMIDAIDDLEKDKKRGEYNPLISDSTPPIEFADIACTLELQEAYKAINSVKIENQPLSAIINNILTLGMPEVQEKITGVKK